MSRFFVPAMLFLGTCFFGYLYIVGPQDGTTLNLTRPGKGSVPYNQLKQYEKETQMKIDIDKQQLQMKKVVGGPQLNPGQAKKNDFHKTQLLKDEDPKAIDLRDPSTLETLTLDQRMDAFLAKKQRFEDLAEAKRKLYVERFIEEALAMGFIVEVNENLEITKVQKIADN